MSRLTKTKGEVKSNGQVTPRDQVESKGQSQSEGPSGLSVPLSRKSSPGSTESEGRLLSTGPSQNVFLPAGVHDKSHSTLRLFHKPAVCQELTCQLLFRETFFSQPDLHPFWLSMCLCRTSTLFKSAFNWYTKSLRQVSVGTPHSILIY